MSTSAHPMMASQSIDAAVLALLWERYGVSPGAAATLELLGDEYGKHILAARAGNGAGGEHLPDGTPALPWVVRVYPPLRRPEAWEAHAPDALAAHARVLRLLAAYGYPAPRVVPAADGALLTSLAEGAAARPVLVTTYIEGQATGLAQAGLRAHGQTLGRLHALPTVQDQHGEQKVRAAEMLPRNELAAAQSWLREVRDRVPRALVARYDALEGACARLDRFDDAPCVLIHNDCHPWNSVRDAGGQVTLVDWEGAGLGPAAIDVGFVALSADTGGIVGPVVSPDPARLEALLGSYRQQHTLSGAELDRLPDAIRFRTLVAAGSNFADAIRKGRAEDERPWYWQRYELAEEIADRARRILEGGS